MEQTHFSEKCEALAKLSVDRNYLDRIPDYLEDFVRVDEFVLTLAWCLTMGFAEPNSKSVELIEASYRDYEEIMYAN